MITGLYQSPMLVGRTTGKAVFSCIEEDQTFEVPSDVTELAIKLWGAGGMGIQVPGLGVGGAGGFTSGVLDVTPGETLTLIVGSGSTGYGGGYSDAGARTGGGRSAIRRGTTELVTAGGGGGGSYAGDGGAGGGLSGASGTGTGSTPGGGGTQTTGGTAGQYAQPGTQFTGGVSAGSNSGGGAGGWYGGGGGGSNGYTGNESGGGGGSGYVDGLSSGTTTAGSGQTPPNTADPDYVTGVGFGGAVTTPGGDGLIVIEWSS